MSSAEMKFTTTHEWVKSDGSDVVTIGITDHAQEMLGDLVYVELPTISSKISKGTTIGVIESVKAASDLYAPISGEVIEINDAVVSEPPLVNQHAHTDGWLFKVKLNNPQELDSLLKLDKYQDLIGE